MATAEEILTGAAETIPDAEVNNKVIRIDSNLRTMSIPAEFGPLGVESDDDVNKVQFEIPRYYGEIDLSTFEVRINYMNANGDGDIYDVIDLNIVEDNLVFSWLVGSLALAYKGDVKFIVCFKKLNEDFTVSKEFNTTLASLPVLEGLEPSKHLIDVYPDIIERMLRYMEAPISSEQIYTAVENYLKNNPIISEHNLSKEAHEDIRQLILGLTNRLNALANSDDTTLDQLSEIVAYIKSNRSLIDAITTGKVSTSDIVDNLVTNVGTKVLSAAQGVALKAMIDEAVSTLSEQMATKSDLKFSYVAQKLIALGNDTATPLTTNAWQTILEADVSIDKTGVYLFQVHCCLMSSSGSIATVSVIRDGVEFDAKLRDTFPLTSSFGASTSTAAFVTAIGAGHYTFGIRVYTFGEASARTYGFDIVKVG